MKKQQSGFTLVEIAIVLVIIGLLLGGVLKGQELINSAKVKSLASDFRAVPTFIYGYQDRFRAMPGDDRLADTRVAGAFRAATPAGGIGNNVIEGDWNSTIVTDESFLFWQHVRLANLAVGPTGFSGAGGVAAFTPTNSEGGRIGVTGTAPDAAGWNGSFFVCSGNIAGRFAQQIDTTMDDGVTTTGSVRVFPQNLAATAAAVALAPANDATLYTVCVAY